MRNLRVQKRVQQRKKVLFKLALLFLSFVHYQTEVRGSSGGYLPTGEQHQH